MNGHLLVQRQPPVATITINRPDQRNAISFAMWGELSRLLTDLPIAALAPLSQAVNKRILNQVLANPSFSNLTPQEADLPLTQFHTQDYREGYRAFLENLVPRLIGQ